MYTIPGRKTVLNAGPRLELLDEIEEAGERDIDEDEGADPLELPALQAQVSVNIKRKEVRKNCHLRYCLWEERVLKWGVECVNIAF